MDIQEIFFSQKNFYLLHNLIKDAMNSKYNYDINDEFNQMLINIMEGIYEKATQDFPNNMSIKDAKKE